MNRSNLILITVALAIMGLGAGLLLRLKTGQRLGKPGVKLAAVPGTNEWRVLLPEQVLDYRSEAVPTTEVERLTLPPDTTFGKRFYQAPDGFAVFTSVVLMGTDRTSIHKPEFCLEGQGWTTLKTEQLKIPITRPAPFSLPVTRMTLGRTVKARDGSLVEMRGMYVFWFVADGAMTGSHWERIRSMSTEMLRSGTLQRWAYVACLSTFPPGREEAAYERMKQFLAAAVPEFQTTHGTAGMVKGTPPVSPALAVGGR
jgi:hypothetical protein